MDKLEITFEAYPDEPDTRDGQPETFGHLLGRYADLHGILKASMIMEPEASIAGNMITLTVGHDDDDVKLAIAQLYGATDWTDFVELADADIVIID